MANFRPRLLYSGTHWVAVLGGREVSTTVLLTFGLSQYSALQSVTQSRNWVKWQVTSQRCAVDTAVCLL